MKGRGREEMGGKVSLKGVGEAQKAWGAELI